MSRRVTLRGFEQVMAKSKTLEQAYKAAIASALHLEAKRIMKTSKSEYVPVDSGALRASGYVQPTEFIGPVASVELGYGGTERVPYATWLHENPRAGKTEGLRPGIRGIKGHGYSSWAGTGQWKYLEEPAFAYAQTSAARIALDVKRMVAALRK